jgi:hypothetical protein
MTALDTEAEEKRSSATLRKSHNERTKTMMLLGDARMRASSMRATCAHAAATQAASPNRIVDAITRQPPHATSAPSPPGRADE